MKVLFYNHTGLVSGAERVLLMILNGINRQRYEPVVVCPADSPMMELANNAGVRTRAASAVSASPEVSAVPATRTSLPRSR